MRPPYIIIGMHRSGTSFLAKVLERSGIFMGQIKDPNFEAMHFLSENQKALWAANFDWHKPGIPGREHWTQFDAQTLYREHFKLNGRLARLKQNLKNEDWGWKDPRNTFTLAMWLEMFPKARVIHMYRNADDVVRSLQQRNNLEGEVYAEEIQSESYCRNLHQQYVEQARSYQTHLGKAFLELDYDLLCRLDKATIKALNDFTGKSVERSLKSLVHA